MQDLLIVPFKKLSKYRGFWWFLLTVVVVIFMSIWALMGVDLTAIGLPQLSTKSFFVYPMIWTLLPWHFKLAGYFLSSMIIMLICHDQENGLMRQHVIDGWSRERLLTSYMTLALLFVLTTTLALLLAGFIFGVKENLVYFDLSSFEAVFGFTLQNFITLQFAIMLSLVFKRAVICIVAFLSWQLVCEPILGMTLSSLKFTWGAKLLPFTVIDQLMPSLKSLLPQFFSGQVEANSNGLNSNTILFSFAYLFLFSASSWAALRRSDL